MTDINPKQIRSHIMAMIKGKNTKPEIIVRRYLFSRGLRYRTNDRKLPGSPDIVLPRFKTVIFINGCFWHGHENCKTAHIPKSNVEFWTNKIGKNKILLKNMGWTVITVWECQLKKDIKEKTLFDLETLLYGIFLKINTRK